MVACRPCWESGHRDGGLPCGIRHPAFEALGVPPDSADGHGRGGRHGPGGDSGGGDRVEDAVPHPAGAWRPPDRGRGEHRSGHQYLPQGRKVDHRVRVADRPVVHLRIDTGGRPLARGRDRSGEAGDSAGRPADPDERARRRGHAAQPLPAFRNHPKPAVEPGGPRGAQAAAGL